MTTMLAPPSADLLLRPTVRIRPAPPLEPPYDERSTARPTGPRNGDGDGDAKPADTTQWQALPLPFEDLGRPTFERTERPRPPGAPRRIGRQGGLRSAAATPPADPGDPRRFAARLARLTEEVMAGDRAVSQIAPLLSPTVRAVLKRRLRFVTRTPDPPPRRRPSIPVRAPVVMLSEPRPGVAEAGVVLHRRERTRAYAMRLELRHGRWCCTALEIV